MVRLEAQLALASLLCSRLCHDLVSPIGAIGNGIEVLAEEDEAQMREQAIALIADSAERASQKLQYLRLALGSAGGPDARIALDEAGTIARAYFAQGRYTLDWQVTDYDADRRVGRLLLSLILVGEEALPRGGRIEAVLAAGGGEITITATGTGARVPPEWDVDAALAVGFADTSARGAQICYAVLLGRALGATLQAQSGTDRVTLTATIPIQS